MFYIRACDKANLAVYDPNPAGRETILMIHGWPLSAKIFEYQTDALINCGYRVVTMDLRGFGKSDAPACCYNYDTMADDIYQVVRALNLHAFTLVGFSMGGAIVLRYMKRRRGYGVKKLILLAAAAPRFTQAPGFPYGMTIEAVDDLISQIKADRAQFSKTFSRELLYSPHSDAIKDWFCDISLSASSIGTIASGYALRDEDGRSDLRAVRVPTGIFHGMQDQIVPFELGKIQNQSIPGSQLFAFENSGHGVFYDELERFNRCFFQFLKGEEQR